jgi:hypothetical protein
MSCPDYNTANSSGWVYQQPRKNKNGGMSVNMQLSSTQLSTPKVQLERLRCPFGIQDGLEASSRKNLEIDVSAQSLREWAQRLDEQNLNWIVENSVMLFKKEMKRATVEALYRPLLTTPSNAAYNPLLRLKINSEGGQATRVMIVMSEGNATAPLKWRHGTLADIERHAEVIPIVEITGLWFVSKGCGMTLVATDLLVFPKRARGFDFNIPFASGVVQCENIEEDIECNMPDPSMIGSAVSMLPSSPSDPSRAPSEDAEMTAN